MTTDEVRTASSARDPLHNVDVEHEHATSTSGRRCLGDHRSRRGISQLLMWRCSSSSRTGDRHEPHLAAAAAPATMPKNHIGTAVFSRNCRRTAVADQRAHGPAAAARQGAEGRCTATAGSTRAPGVARMPIDEAKKLILERGLPVAKARKVAALGTRLPARGESSGGRIITAPAQTPRSAPRCAEGGRRQRSSAGAPHTASSPPPSRRAAAATEAMFAPHCIRRTLAIAAMTAVVSAAPAVAQVGVTADGAGEPASARPGLLSKIHIDQHLDNRCRSISRSWTRAASRSGSATTSASARW